jgi:hypothetical protein
VIVTKKEMVFELSEKEVSVWLAALRLAALRSVEWPDPGTSAPWNSCPFLRQHGLITSLTGTGFLDHENLYQELKAKHAGK